MKSDNKDKIKVMPSLFVAISCGILILSGYSLALFLFATRSEISMNIFIMSLFFVIVLPTIILILMIISGYYSVISIDEKGIYMAFLGVFLKRGFAWDEIKNIRYVNRIFPFVFISDKVLSNYSYEKLIMMHNVIQISLTKKVARIIRKYTDLPITGMSEEELQEYIQENKEKSQ